MPICGTSGCATDGQNDENNRVLNRVDFPFEKI